MKFLDDILLEQTGSTPAAPVSNDFGILYASSSKLHFRNSVTNVTLGQTNGRINILYYTGSRTQTENYTYTVPSGLVFAEIICVGAGGCGGSGRGSNVAAVTTIGIRQGGSGGAGGTIVRSFYSVNELGGVGNTHTVTVQLGGAGGAGVVPIANGINGSTGGNTSFGTLVVATGGQGGELGTTGGTRTAATSSINTCTPPSAVYAIIGQPGSTSGTTALTTTPGIALTSPFGCSAGGTGGGFGGTGGSQREASSGSSAYQWETLVTNGGTPGALKLDGTPGGNGSPGTDNLSVSLLHFTSSIVNLQYGIGGGGHGGGYPTGSGGNGGLFGAGGGGGASSWSTTKRSGAGGSGSAGVCIVVEYL